MSSRVVPGGRLVRLGAVVPSSMSPALLRRVATLSERAGLDAIWIAPFGHTTTSSDEDMLAMLADAAEETGTIVLGAWLRDVPSRFPPPLAGRLEVTVPIERRRPCPATLARIWCVAGQVRHWPPGDLLVVPAASLAPPPRPSRAKLAVAVPLSIGRTTAEAEARARDDPLFAMVGYPSQAGIFGTLEECQQQVLSLARAGVVDVRCILPSTPDVHDVIAQLSAVPMGGRPGRSALRYGSRDSLVDPWIACDQ